MATPAATNAGQPDHEGPRFANMTDTVTIKVETTESFTVHTSLLLRESNFFKQQEQLLVENKSFDLPLPHKAAAFEVFVKYLYSSRIPQNITWPIGDSIEAYKLGKFLEAEQFATLCDEHVRAQLFLKSPHPRLSDLCMLADLADDPIKNLILERIAWLIVEGRYEASEDVSAKEDDLDAVAQPIWKELFASIIVQARKRSRDQSTAYGYSNGGPGFATATGGFGQSGQHWGWTVGNTNGTNSPGGLFGQPCTSAGNSTRTLAGTGGGLFGSQQSKSTTRGGLFGNAQTTNNVGGGLFSNTTRQASIGGSLFGNNNTNSATSTGGLFGQAHPPSDSAFGVDASTSGGAFQGLTRPQPLFGAPQTNQSSGGLFGQPQPTSNTHGFSSSVHGTPGGGFGGSTESHGTIPASTSSVFGGLGTGKTPGFQPPQSGGYSAFGCAGGVGSARAVGTTTPFPPHTEQEYNGATAVYQSIAATPAYRNTSHEELRFHNYEGAHRSGEVEKSTSKPQTGLFAKQGSFNQVPAGTQNTNPNRKADLAAENAELQAKIVQMSSTPTQSKENTKGQSVSPIPSNTGAVGQDAIRELERKMQSLEASMTTILSKLNMMVGTSGKRLSTTKAVDSDAPDAEAVATDNTTSAHISGMSTPEVIETPASNTSSSKDAFDKVMAGGASNREGDTTTKANPNDVLSLAPLSNTAKALHAFLKNAPASDEGHHQLVIALGMKLKVAEVHQAAQELLDAGFVYETVDENTWAVLDD